jgi:hypothetical protein
MKNQGKFKPDLAAAVLITAAYVNDEEACKQYGVSLRSLQNWRRRLHEDAEFADFFTTKSREAGQRWAEQLPVALTKALQFLSAAADAVRLDPLYLRNPMVVQAIAGAFKLCADVHLTSKVLDARLANSDRPENGLPEQIPADQRSVEYAN